MNKAISIFNEISHEYKMAYEMVNQIGDCYKKLVQEPPGTSLGVSRQSPGILLYSMSCTTATPFYFTYWTLMCVFWMCIRWTFRVSLAKYSMMLWFGIYIFILKRSYIDCPLFYTLRLSKSNGVRYLFLSKQSNSPIAIIYIVAFISPYMNPQTCFIYRNGFISMFNVHTNTGFNLANHSYMTFFCLMYFPPNKKQFWLLA